MVRGAYRPHPADLHQIKGEWGNSKFPMVPGHEIVGIVTEVGKGGWGGGRDNPAWRAHWRGFTGGGWASKQPARASQAVLSAPPPPFPALGRSARM